jgi:hypothetical protein
MKLKTGRIAFPIEFDNGDKEVIYFNPTDPEFMLRLKKLQSRLSEKAKQITDVELKADGTPVDSNNIELVDKLNQAVKDEIDVAFGSSVSDAIFKYVSPFGIVDGEFYVVLFFEAITPEIEKYVKEAVAKYPQKYEKHVKKYM